MTQHTTRYTVNGRQFNYRAGLYRDASGIPKCNALSAEGYQCTRDNGHEGDHTAEDVGISWTEDMRQ